MNVSSGRSHLRRLAPIGVATVLAACGSTSPPHHPVSVSVAGTVTASPTCPVERAGRPCPPAPVAGGIEARDTNGNVMASGPIAADGSYSLSLVPGAYTLHVDVGAVLPRCPDTPVSVKAGEVTHADITCDSGIR